MISKTLALIAALACATLHAAEFTQKDADELVKRLGSEEFRVRKDATDQLQKLILENPDAEKLFEAYKNHHDPEVRARLREGMVVISREAGWWPPSAEGRIRSPEDEGPRRLQMTNDWKQPILIFWLDTEGKRRPWSASEITPGRTVTCHISYEGHAWLFTDKDGKALGIYTLGEDTKEIRFEGPVK